MHNSNSSSKCFKVDNSNSDKNHKTYLQIRLGINKTTTMVLAFLLPSQLLNSSYKKLTMGIKLIPVNSTLHKLPLPRYPRLRPFPAPLPVSAPHKRREVRARRWEGSLYL